MISPNRPPFVSRVPCKATQVTGAIARVAPYLERLAHPESATDFHLIGRNQELYLMRDQGEMPLAYLSVEAVGDTETQLSLQPRGWFHLLTRGDVAAIFDTISRESMWSDPGLV